MTDFRGPLPLGDDDFAEVRRKVRARLERRPIAPIVFRFAAAAAAAALVALVIILLPRPEPPVMPPVPAHKAVPDVAQTLLSAPGKARVPAPHKAAPHKKQRAPEQRIASVGGPPPDSEMTMNIQTADPNVRIVWITQR